MYVSGADGLVDVQNDLPFHPQLAHTSPCSPWPGHFIILLVTDLHNYIPAMFANHSAATFLMPTNKSIEIMAPYKSVLIS